MHCVSTRQAEYTQTEYTSCSVLMTYTDDLPALPQVSCSLLLEYGVRDGQDEITNQRVLDMRDRGAHEASRRGRNGEGSRPCAIGLDMCPGGSVETRIARDPSMLPVQDGHFHDPRVSRPLVCAATALERHSV